MRPGQYPGLMGISSICGHLGKMGDAIERAGLLFQAIE